MGWRSVVYTREDLFRQVWDEPVTHVAKRIGISDVALAKVCRRMGIPLPGRGCWAREAAGHAPSRPHRCLDMSAQGPALDRACRIMDTVLRELEARGHSIEVTAPKSEGQQREPSRTLVSIGDSSVQIGIDEAVGEQSLDREASGEEDES